MACNAGLSRLTTDEKLKEAFAPFGNLVEGIFLFNLYLYYLLSRYIVLFGKFHPSHQTDVLILVNIAAKVIVDRACGRSKGFGFVTYGTIEEAEKAREGMNAKFLDGWVIFVDPAKPREYKPPQQQQQPSNTGYTTNKTIGWCG